MQIPCKDIQNVVKSYLTAHIAQLKNDGHEIKLVTFLIGEAPEQLSFVGIKKRVAEEIGAHFELKQYREIPELERFQNDIVETVNKNETTGIIIQHPLPDGFNAKELYELVPSEKEIEGHKPGSTFHFPLSLSVLSGMKYIVLHKQNPAYTPDDKVIIDFQKDAPLLHKEYGDKKVVIAGRGITGGKPIAKALSDINIPYEMIHTQSSDNDQLLKNADVIITATGTKLLSQYDIKPGVILLNVGLRKEDGRLKGDFDEDEIKNTTSYFTRTPGGLGPLDVLYLYKNLFDAATLS